MPFKKAASEKSYMKVGLYGEQGSGKTLTALLVAEGLAKLENKRVAYIDTEKGTKFYSRSIPERAVHPEAFDFDRVITRSIMEALAEVEKLNPSEYGVLIIDSITALWDAAREAYRGPRLSNGAIPMHKWGEIKKPYKRLMSLFLDGDYHGIICGREGVLMEADDSTGQSEVIGKKMKAESETPYEPDVLIRMRNDRDTKSILAYVEKDRSGILTNSTIEYPRFDHFRPLYSYLHGGEETKLGSLEEVADRDAAVIQEQAERADMERTRIFDAIRSAIHRADSLDELKAAWELTKGKKTKLGDLFAELESAKETRKRELNMVVGV